MAEVKKVILINPATKPMDTLSRALGEAPNFYDGSFFSWREKHLEMLKQYERSFVGEEAALHNFFVLLQKGDELLDYSDAQRKYNGAKVVVEEGGSHSFDGIERYLQSIKDFMR